MEFFDVIKNRRSVRKFTEEIPAQEDVKKIIDAARLAPSGHNKQNWYFIVIYNDELKSKLKEAVSNKYEKFKSFPEAKDSQKSLEHSKKFSTFFDKAPVLIAVLNEQNINSVERILKERNVAEKLIACYRPRPDLQSIGAAIQNISLAAIALGYATCWMTAPIVAYQEMEKLLNIEPQYRLVALVCLGKPANGYSKAIVKSKKTLEEILTIIE